MSHIRSESGEIELPNEFETIIAMIDCGELGMMPRIGYRMRGKGFNGEHIDVICVEDKTVSFYIVKKWDYIADVLPQYAPTL